MITSDLGVAVALDDLGPIGDAVGAGGQGAVHRLPEHPGLLLKSHATPPDRAGLEALVRWRHGLSDRDRRIVDAATSWPIALVDAPEGSRVLFRAAGERFYLDVAGARQVRDLQWAFCRSVSYVGLAPASPRTAVALVHAWATVLDVLHRNGAVYGDLSATNLLWNGRAIRPSIFAIDCDAAWVTEAPRAIVPGQTPLFDEPWESDGSPGAERRRDLYKVGLLFLRLFFHSQLPVTADVRVVDLPADPPLSRPVLDLLNGALQRDGDRPDAAAWLAALPAFDRALRGRNVP